jgi:dynein heavy chain 1
MESEIELEVKALTTCAYSNATFTEILNRIQKAVDNLSLHAYSNLQQWVARLDQRVSYRIQKAVDNLSSCLSLVLLYPAIISSNS